MLRRHGRDLSFAPKTRRFPQLLAGAEPNGENGSRVTVVPSQNLILRDGWLEVW
jgi:hypothetical protein